VTPVHFILCYAVTALAVTRLWVLGAPVHLIAGLFFILAGLAKYVETRVVRRPSLYQWAAIASVVCGALMTAMGKSSPGAH
jgi:hypothetical protein